jgi:hypothetical protein
MKMRVTNQIRNIRVYRAGIKTLICWSYILLYTIPIFPYMSILYILISRSYILLYSGPKYSYMPVLYTILCQSYILLSVCSIYLYMPVNQIRNIRVYRAGIKEYSRLSYKSIMDWHIRIDTSGI